MDSWIESATRYGVELSGTQVDQFGTYEALLQAWSQRINLTTITDSAEIQRRHFLDSLSFGLVDLSRFETNDALKLIDMGTGAGFPGLPIKIAFPHLSVTLADSVTKKTVFLSEVVKRLGLTRVEIVADRAEAVGQNPAHRARYDIAVARSVAYMPVLSEYLLPLVKVGGLIVAFKGERAEAEAAEANNGITLLGGRYLRSIPVELPGEPAPHYLVLIEKVNETPARYPRRAGMPKKRPLA